MCIFPSGTPELDTKITVLQRAFNAINSAGGFGSLSSHSANHHLQIPIWFLILFSFLLPVDMFSLDRGNDVSSIESISSAILIINCVNSCEMAVLFVIFWCRMLDLSVKRDFIYVVVHKYTTCQTALSVCSENENQNLK